jgi:hypothetical protein
MIAEKMPRRDDCARIFLPSFFCQLPLGCRGTASAARSQRLRTNLTKINSLRTTPIVSTTCYLITPYVNTSVCAPRGAICEAVRKHRLPISQRQRFTPHAPCYPRFGCRAAQAAHKGYSWLHPVFVLSRSCLRPGCLLALETPRNKAKTAVSKVQKEFGSRRPDVHQWRRQENASRGVAQAQRHKGNKSARRSSSQFRQPSQLSSTRGGLTFATRPPMMKDVGQIANVRKKAGRSAICPTRELLAFHMALIVRQL